MFLYFFCIAMSSLQIKKLKIIIIIIKNKAGKLLEKTEIKKEKKNIRAVGENV